MQWMECTAGNDVDIQRDVAQLGRGASDSCSGSGFWKDSGAQAQWLASGVQQGVTPAIQSDAYLPRVAQLHTTCWQVPVHFKESCCMFWRRTGVLCALGAFLGMTMALLHARVVGLLLAASLWPQNLVLSLTVNCHR